MSLDASALQLRLGSREVLSEVSLRVLPGELHVLLGPNGAGKSSLLRLLAGDCNPSSGAVQLEGRPLPAFPVAALARRRAVLLQEDHLSFPFRVEEVVALGRLPCPRHRPAQERALIRAVLAAAGAEGLWGRRYPELSGGERRRVQLARVLAQVWEPVPEGPRYLLLDEPTAALDLAHQHRCLDLARHFARQGNGVCVVLHDPNLALVHADRVSLLKDGRIVAAGHPRETLTAAVMTAVYGVRSWRFEPGADWPYPVLATGSAAEDPCA